MTNNNIDNQKVDVNELLDFINASPTAFHVVENVLGYLRKNGYKEYDEKSIWKLCGGSKGYVVRNGSAIIAFSVPKDIDLCDNRGFKIAAAHADSPCFKVKDNSLVTLDNRYAKVNVEKYGGMILQSWFDRPLSVAGRVVYHKNDRLISKLVNVDRDLFIIPSLAIHMSRGAVKEDYSIQKEMLPLLGMTKEGHDLMNIIKNENRLEDEDILGADLFLYNRQSGTLLGGDKELIASPRLDDAECVFAGLMGLINNKEASDGKINVFAVFDNEEVGSTTRQGADSDFLFNTLDNIAEGLSIDSANLRRMIARSFMLSLDNAHALHPNYPEKADITNKPYLNDGIVIKYHGGQKYTTDAWSGAYIKQLCKNNQIPYQSYYNNSDIAGGSTLGNIVSSKVSIAAADVGVAQLAMHSAYETAGTKDLHYLNSLCTAFFK